jgi:hypothetical protein
MRSLGQPIQATNMTVKPGSHAINVARSNWIYYVLIVLIAEKIVQHIFVTLAFYFNWDNIGSTVAIAPTVLMILGALAAALFMLGLGGMLLKQSWAIHLVIVLALVDIVGEFAAQGTIGIVITVSFLVAVLLLVLALLYRRQSQLI